MTQFSKLLKQPSKQKSSTPADQLKQTLLSSFAAFNAYMSDPVYLDEFNTDFCNFMQFGPLNKVNVLPRGARKTTVGTIRYSQWRAIKNTNIRILWIFNTADNAMKKLDRLRSEFESDPRLYRMFPEVIPNFRKTVWTRSAACLQRTSHSEECTFEAVGISSAIASRHYDIVIFDDPTSPEKEDVTDELVMPNLRDIEQAIGKFKLATFMFDKPAGAEFILNTTRWSDNDLVDYIKKHRREGLTKFGFFERKIIENGKPLMKRFPLEIIEQMRRDLGPYFFSCLCMNVPLEAHLRTFKPEMIQHWSPGMTFLGNGLRCVTVDPAMGKEKQKGCLTGINTSEHVESNIVVLESIGAYLNADQTAKRAVDMVVKWGATRIGIEDVAYQMVLEYPIKAELKDRGITGVVIDAIKVGKKSKEIRTEALCPLAARGQLFLPQGQTNLENQLLAYPFTSSKDEIDALTLQMKYYNLYKALEKKPQLTEVVRPGKNEIVFDVAAHWDRLDFGDGGRYGYEILDRSENLNANLEPENTSWAF